MNIRNIPNKEKIIQNETKVHFENLKNNYILKKLLSYIKKNKLLKVIKCNKKLQKRLDIDIKDYIECYKLTCTSIELELMPVNNDYGLFINISDKDKKYYHIYFNNSKEKIKKNYFDKNENVKIINIIIEHQIKSFQKLFYKCRCVRSVFFKKSYRNDITDMSYMFSGCSSLYKVDLSKFNTNNVTDMSYMFDECSSLNELNLSNFNTNNVINMCYMFYGCSSLYELNLSNFYTNKVTNMSFMFGYCLLLNRLNISNFNTNNVTNMSYMFYECKSLKELNISNFDTNNVTNMKNMFLGCSNGLKDTYKKLK